MTLDFMLTLASSSLAMSEEAQTSPASGGTWIAIATAGWTVVWAIWSKVYIDRKSSRLEKEHSVRFEALHIRQVKVVERLYRSLSDLEGAIAMASETGHSPQRGAALISAVMQRGNEIRRECMRSRIWLPPTTCVLLDELWVAFKNLGYAIADEYAEAAQQGREPRVGPSQVEAFRQKGDLIRRQQLEPLFAVLEAEFRDMLGVIH